jgi:hypothetical protein
MAKENQYELIDALKAHINNLEVERYCASGKTQAALAERLEAANRSYSPGAVLFRDFHSA